ncbi:hypothetical protein, partial [Salmonella sp. gx-f5]|uniref:hypothetical protein n=1 Tax=Salmonella sp. gx-f5 TaxID=2582605 RepID=UPI001F1A2087
RLLVRVASKIEIIFHNFLWGGMGDDKKLHLESWDKVCSSITCRGLGIRNLRLFNKARLDKWLWRYQLDRDALWKNIIDAKHGEGLGELV